jgi:hypothetical protein
MEITKITNKDIIIKNYIKYFSYFKNYINDLFQFQLDNVVLPYFQMIKQGGWPPLNNKPQPHQANMPQQINMQQQLQRQQQANMPHQLQRQQQANMPQRRPLTYRIFYNAEYKRETYSYLVKELNALGWREEPYNKKYVNFAFSLLNNIHISADFKYTLKGFKNISEKDKLFKVMGSNAFIPYTTELTNYKWCGDIIIIREVLSNQQKGVHVIVDEQEFLKIQSKLAHTRAVVSKYITNPLLFEGKKFHLRIYIVIYVHSYLHPQPHHLRHHPQPHHPQPHHLRHHSQPHHAQSHASPKLIKKILYMEDNITLKLANKKYVIHKKEDYLDFDINITGGAFTDRLVYFSELEKHHSHEFMAKCKRSIHDAIHSIPLDNISLYKEQKAGMFLFGTDIMLDDTGHAWIIELNDRPGLIPKVVSKYFDNTKQKKYTEDFFKGLFRWILDNVVLPFFYPK